MKSQLRALQIKFNSIELDLNRKSCDELEHCEDLALHDSNLRTVTKFTPSDAVAFSTRFNSIYRITIRIESYENPFPAINHI